MDHYGNWSATPESRIRESIWQLAVAHSEFLQRGVDPKELQHLRDAIREIKKGEAK
jgi:hypothetical protein